LREIIREVRKDFNEPVLIYKPYEPKTIGNKIKGENKNGEY
jgi:hypothetical protein